MDTTAPNLSEHPWMEHDVTGHRAQLPDIPYWRENGWHPCDGPPLEPDLTRDTTPEAPSTPAGSLAVKGKKATKSAADKAQATKSAADKSATSEDGETVG